MKEYEFDLSTVNRIAVQASDGDEAIHDFLTEVERAVEQGRVPVEQEKTFRVRAQATDCTYHVAGKTRQEAEDALRRYIEERKQMVDDSHFGPERSFIKDLSTETQVEKEVEGVDPEINTDGERIT